MKTFENTGLEIGSSGKLLVREEELHLSPDNPIPFKVLYVSDIHLSGKKTMKLIGQLSEAVDKTGPDLILLGGDLVDDRLGISILADGVRELVSFAPVASVAGNHDHSAGLIQVRKAVEKEGGLWLGRDSFFFEVGQKKVCIDGNIKREKKKGVERLLCAHFPNVFPLAAQMGYRLVFAGHLHGCQFVFWEKDKKLYPGAWFYRWNGLRFQDGPCTLLVSRGVSDSMPVRWNCPREVLLCNIF